MQRNYFKNVMTLAIVAAGALMLTVGAGVRQAEAVTWYTTGSGNRTIDNLTHWTDQSNGSAGANPGALPVAGNTDTWVVRGNNRLSASPSNTTWYGGTMQLLDLPSNDGEFQLWRENFTIQDAILDGGALNVGGNTGSSHTLTGKTLTLNSGIIGVERTVATYVGAFDFDTYTGDGDILIQGRGNGSTHTSQHAHVQFAGGGDFSAFTGSFTVQAGMTLEFDTDIIASTFDIAVETGGGAFQGLYNLLNNVSVTSLTLGAESIANGTYSYGDFTAAQQVYLVDNDGTITVGGTIAVPEPATATLAMLGLGGLLMRRKRAA